MTPSRYILLLLIGSVFALLGVAQRAHNVHLGLQVEGLKVVRDRQDECNRQLLCEISALSDPVRIADQVERLHIALLDPVALTKAAASEQHDEAGTTAGVTSASRRAH
jgi:cell division protein FtsL